MRTQTEIMNRIDELKQERKGLETITFFDVLAAIKRRNEIQYEIKGLLFALEESKEKQIITINI